MKHSSTALIVLFSLGLSACTDEQKDYKRPDKEFEPTEKTLVAESPSMRLVPASESGIQFKNQIYESLANNLITNPNIYNGGGVAVIDVNNDNLPDLYFVGSNGPNALYLNKGDLKFEDITRKAGVGAPEGFKTGVYVVDINKDGFMDIYLCRGGSNIDVEERRNRLFVNNGDLTFKEESGKYGLDDPSLSVGAAFLDYDKDGDLDLYLINTPTSQDYINKLDAVLDPVTQKYVPNIYPRDPMDSDRLYRNDGSKFTDVTKRAGVYNMGYSQSVTVTDFNLDGYPDLYIANDYLQPDLLYINQKNGTFKDELASWIQHSSQHTMGADLADFDNDGLVDLVTLDMMPDKHYRRKSTTNTNSQVRYNTIVQNGYFEPVVRNVLQRNNGNGTFSEIACLAGIFKTDWSWGSLFFDIDNDGFKDLAIANGFRREVTDADFIHFTYPKMNEISKSRPFKSVEDLVQFIPTYKVRNYVYRNAGDWTFEDKSGDWLTMPPSWSNGSVYVDLDRDGDLEWVVNNLEETPFVYENLHSGKSGSNYLQLQLNGTSANPHAFGTRVKIVVGGKQQFQEMYTTRGIYSSQEPLLHFGLGDATNVDSCIVIWPNGKTTVLTNVKANQRISLNSSEASTIKIPSGGNVAVFESKPGNGLDFRHREAHYDDFNDYFLLPWRLTDLGPVLSKADVNNDGLEDVFVGNAEGSPAGMFLQTEDGGFVAADNTAFDESKGYEDHGSVFFDYDSDGDQDLLVISGGFNALGSDAWVPRLFENDGQGNFSKDPKSAFPAVEVLGMRAAVHDFDGDQDLDVFIGGRAQAGKYPLSPRNMIMRNDGGRFVDVTDEVGGDFIKCGMIADLFWADLDGDKKEELVAAGEWTPIRIFSLNKGKLKEQTGKFGLNKSGGFWNRIVPADLDGDGDIDIVAGNFGLNSRMVASEEEPFHCFAGDIDGNGSIDPILAYYEDGYLFPYRHRDILIRQVPEFKKKFVYYKDFGKAILPDLFKEGQLDTTPVLDVHTLQTCWWENQNGKFVRRDFPPQAQVAPVQGIVVFDFNNDGNKDVFLVGNKYWVEVETGRMDAGTGCLLTGDGNGGFRWESNLKSGLWAQKQARDVVVLNGNKGPIVVVANNDDVIEVYGKKEGEEKLQ